VIGNVASARFYYSIHSCLKQGLRYEVPELFREWGIVFLIVEKLISGTLLRTFFITMDFQFLFDANF